VDVSPVCALSALRIGTARDPRSACSNTAAPTRTFQDPARSGTWCRACRLELDARHLFDARREALVDGPATTSSRTLRPAVTKPAFISLTSQSPTTRWPRPTRLPCGTKGKRSQATQPADRFLMLFLRSGSASVSCFLSAWLWHPGDVFKHVWLVDHHGSYRKHQEPSSEHGRTRAANRPLDDAADQEGAGQRWRGRTYTRKRRGRRGTEFPAATSTPGV
jgi:hypothetical protein